MEIKLKQRTAVEPLNYRGLINHSSRLVMLGSCFVESVGSLMKRDLYDVTINPFGPIYNPASLARNAHRLLTGQPYCENELIFHGSMWHSSDHHSRFSSEKSSEALKIINEALAKGHDAATNADIAVLTLGTSWVYSDKATGTTVNNCHKRPACEFTRYKLSVDETIGNLKEVMDLWLKVNPRIRFILTVSPIRHLADGFHGNTVSKATLQLAASAITDIHYPGVAVYFPSYEIMIDDLRDYRYYSADMSHPTEQAVEYIYRVFEASFLDAASVQLASGCRKLTSIASHRTLTDSSVAKEQLRNKIEQLLAGLTAENNNIRTRFYDFIENNSPE